jgi:thioredoxin 1
MSINKGEKMQYIKTVEEFDDLTASGHVVVQFSATWCQPCKVLSRTMENVIPVHKDVEFYKVDIDSIDKKLLHEYNIRSVPKLMIFVHGNDVAEMVGSKTADVINEFIKEHKKLI